MGKYSATRAMNKLANSVTLNTAENLSLQRAANDYASTENLSTDRALNDAAGITGPQFKSATGAARDILEAEISPTAVPYGLSLREILNRLVDELP